MYQRSRSPTAYETRSSSGFDSAESALHSKTGRPPRKRVRLGYILHGEDVNEVLRCRINDIKSYNTRFEAMESYVKNLKDTMKLWGVKFREDIEAGSSG